MNTTSTIFFWTIAVMLFFGLLLEIYDDVRMAIYDIKLKQFQKNVRKFWIETIGQIPELGEWDDGSDLIRKTERKFKKKFPVKPCKPEKF